MNSLVPNCDSDAAPQRVAGLNYTVLLCWVCFKHSTHPSPVPRSGSWCVNPEGSHTCSSPLKLTEMSSSVVSKQEGIKTNRSVQIHVDSTVNPAKHSLNCYRSKTHVHDVTQACRDICFLNVSFLCRLFSSLENRQMCCFDIIPQICQL